MQVTARERQRFQCILSKGAPEPSPHRATSFSSVIAPLRISFRSFSAVMAAQQVCFNERPDAGPRRPHGDAIVARKFDRGVEDVGNILALEHLNLTVPDQATAALFYVSGLGFTRDPYVDFGVFNFHNMWVNVGDQQFHLPQGKAQHFRGTIGLTVPDLDKLRWRLDQVGKTLSETQFSWRDPAPHRRDLSVGQSAACHAPRTIR